MRRTSCTAFEAKVSCSEVFYCPFCHLTNLEEVMADMQKKLTTLKSMLSTKSPVVGQDNESGQGNGKLMTWSQSYLSVVSGTVLPQQPHTIIHAKGSKCSSPDHAWVCWNQQEVQNSYLWHQWVSTGNPSFCVIEEWPPSSSVDSHWYGGGIRPHQHCMWLQSHGMPLHWEVCL